MSGLHPLLHPIDDAAPRLGVSVSSIWRLIRSGQLRTVKIRGRTLVPESELQRLAQPPSE
jgi:excisionase family DNA binding protein